MYPTILHRFPIQFNCPVAQCFLLSIKIGLVHMYIQIGEEIKDMAQPALFNGYRMSPQVGTPSDTASSYRNAI